MEQEEKIVRLWTLEGIRIVDIAKRFGCSVGRVRKTISEWCKCRGVPWQALKQYRKAR